MLAFGIPEFFARARLEMVFNSTPGAARKQHFRRILLLMQVDGAPSGRLAPLFWMLFGGVFAFLPAALAIPFGPVSFGITASIWLFCAATLKRFPRHRLTRGEWLLEGVRMSFEPSLAAFLLMAAEGLARGIALLGRYAGIPVPASLPHAIALTLFALLWMLIGSVWKNSIAERLGIRINGPQRYIGWEAAEPLGSAILCGFGVILTVLVYFYSHFAAGVLATLTIVVLGGAMGSTTATKEPAERGLSRQVRGAVARILRAAGFEVQEDPRLLDEEVDALLKPLNLYASREGRRLGIAIRTEGTIPIAECVALHAATKLYGGDDATPLVILVGDEALEPAHSEGQHLPRFVRIPKAQIETALNPQSAEQLQEAARRFLAVTFPAAKERAEHTL